MISLQRDGHYICLLKYNYNIPSENSCINTFSVIILLCDFYYENNNTL